MHNPKNEIRMRLMPKNLQGVALGGASIVPSCERNNEDGTAGGCPYSIKYGKVMHRGK